MCTATATTRPTTSMNATETAPLGRPRTAATSGSRLSNMSGRQTATRMLNARSDVAMSQPSCGPSTAITCPVSRPNLLDDRPG